MLKLIIDSLRLIEDDECGELVRFAKGSDSIIKTIKTARPRWQKRKEARKQ